MDWKQFAKGSGMHPSFCDQTAPLPRFSILLGYAFSLLFKKAVNLLDEGHCFLRSCSFDARSHNSSHFSRSCKWHLISKDNRC